MVLVDCPKTYIDIQVMLCTLHEELLVRRPQRERLENIARAVVPLEHRMIDHITEVYTSFLS